MSPGLIQAIGIVGNVLLVSAYLPQIHKTIKTKKAEDLSLLMWLAYFVGDVLLLVYSIATNDAIFTALFTLFTIGNFVLLTLTLKYSKPQKS